MDSDTLKKRVGSKIKQFRTIKGWSRQQAADLLEVSLTAYGDMERGKTDVNITRLGQIAEIFEIALTDLLDSTEKNTFNSTHPPDKINELILKNDSEKSQLIQQSQTKEIEYLKQQIAQLQEIITLMKGKSG